MIQKIFANMARSWRHQLALQLATFSVLVGSFIVLSAGLMVEQNIKKFLFSWGQDIKVSVYLRDEVEGAERSKIEDFINSSRTFASISFLSKEDAYQRFKQRVSKFAPNLVNELEQNNPIPASFELMAASSSQTKIHFEDILSVVNKLKSFAGVEDVSYGQGWVENYAVVLKVFSTISIIMFLVLLVGIIFIIGNSIHSSLEQKREEIELLELFGATRKSIIIPYVFEGIFLGLFSALLSLVIIYLFYSSQIEFLVRELNSFWDLGTKIEFLSFTRMMAVLGTGAMLGGVGSYIWASRMSTGWAAATGRQT